MQDIRTLADGEPGCSDHDARLAGRSLLSQDRHNHREQVDEHQHWQEQARAAVSAFRHVVSQPGR